MTPVCKECGFPLIWSDAMIHKGWICQTHECPLQGRTQ